LHSKKYHCITSTDQAFTHGKIGSSRTVEKTVAMHGCAMKPTNADGFLIVYDSYQFAHGFGPELCANSMAFVDINNFWGSPLVGKSYKIICT
jgi:hypothetical protein